jgi:molybdopterin synthase sulfur carrier subunit
VALVRLPSLLAAQADGRNRLQVEGTTVAEALRALPIADLLFDERGELRPLVNVYVNGVDAREQGGLAAPVENDAEIRVVAAVAGG